MVVVNKVGTDDMVRFDCFGSTFLSIVAACVRSLLWTPVRLWPSVVGCLDYFGLWVLACPECGFAI